VAEYAPTSIFVHAGAVASGGRAILVPGPTFSGKTTLVSELLRAGADYLSDEYAVLDDAGWVSPYERPLSMRYGDWDQYPRDPSQFGAAVASGPIPVGLVVVTHFRAGTQWRPRRLSAGEGALALLANTVPAQDRPEEALHAVSKAVERAVVLEGDRGEAAEIAGLLLEFEGHPLPVETDGAG
jgi:hypothetical protein